MALMPGPIFAPKVKAVARQGGERGIQVFDMALQARPEPLPVAYIMRRRRITVRALAALTGYSEGHLGSVINGHAQPSRRLQAAVSLALGVPTPDLFA